MINRKWRWDQLRFRRVTVWASLALTWFALATPSSAADLAATSSPATKSTERAFAAPKISDERPNSLLFFGGRLSTTDIYSTLAFNLTRRAGQDYDNYIAGVAYDRDVFDLGYGFRLGTEVGIADRFGHYKQCCNPIIRSSSIVQSGELWGGAQFRYGGFTFLDAVRVGFGITFGLSGVNSSIGREAQWSVENNSKNRVLYYFGPEVDVAFPSLPNVEFVLKLQHRSGGKTVPFLPTIADRGEGYNANVVGVRYRF